MFNNQQFILHAGARPASFQELAEVVLPQNHDDFKDEMGKYRTMGHHILASHIRNTIQTFVGPEALISEHYALSTGSKYPGAKMFGMMKVDLGDHAVDEAARLAREFANDIVEEDIDLDRDPDEVDGPKEDPRYYRGHEGQDTDLEVVGDAMVENFEDSDEWGGSKILRPDTITPALFFRNSYDKTMSVATAFGYQVFACDNLAVSGDLQYNRRHTRNMLRDVIATISIMVQTAGRQHAFDLECKKALSEMEINSEQGWQILGEMAGSNALTISSGSRSQFAIALMEWNDPTFACFKPRTMWSLYNAVTFALRMSGINKRLEGASEAHRRFLGHLGTQYLTEAEDINREFAEAIK